MNLSVVHNKQDKNRTFLWRIPFTKFL